jgi:hypothetical protein
MASQRLLAAALVAATFWSASCSVDEEPESAQQTSPAERTAPQTFPQTSQARPETAPAPGPQLAPETTPGPAAQTVTQAPNRVTAAWAKVQCSGQGYGRPIELTPTDPGALDLVNTYLFTSETGGLCLYNGTEAVLLVKAAPPWRSYPPPTPALRQVLLAQTAERLGVRGYVAPQSWLTGNADPATVVITVDAALSLAWNTIDATVDAGEKKLEDAAPLVLSPRSRRGQAAISCAVGAAGQKDAFTNLAQTRASDDAGQWTEHFLDVAGLARTGSECAQDWDRAVRQDARQPLSAPERRAGLLTLTDVTQDARTSAPLTLGARVRQIAFDAGRQLGPRLARGRP